MANLRSVNPPVVQAMGIRFFVYASPLGNIYVASTEKGVCRASLNVAERAFTTALRTEMGGEPIEDEGFFNGLKSELDHYFSGKPTAFSSPVKWLKGTEFQREVWEALLKIPYGEVRSYRQVAEAVGRPKACRAVGAAIAGNPTFLIVPCHRVVRSDGMLGGYGYGVGVKRRLLELEGAKASPDKHGLVFNAKAKL